jgi:FlaA1/EpsC-like NDP-sugar epimerase
MSETSEFYKGKDILVTGSCGSIGKEIVRELLKYDVEKIRVLDNNESGLFYLQEDLRGLGPLRPLIGDIRDLRRLKWAMKGVDLVFHAAALKQVPLCEYNPFEAVSTNVIGTQNVIEAATSSGVERVVAISTDKAVNPINTMGATKLLSEKLILNAHIGEMKIQFSCVRFGNVFNSAGSVIPIFKQQIKEGGPITITSKKMVRYFMTLPKAVNMVLKVAKIMEDRRTYILKMDSLKIIDLAEVLIDELAPRYGFKSNDIKIKEIGVRPGEKLYEKLMTEEEAQYAEVKEGMFVLHQPILTPHYIEKKPVIRNPIRKEQYDGSFGRVLNKEEIKDLISKEKIV